ncbi:hypothetical protein FLB_05140 [Flavobacterium succinicans]|uniref:YhhN-like protein n=2 Tax=Flavobacterium succinicans TaxID=29536 RepID=A0A199XTC0_9FLAO|nr:hypothetical protein FLB_05140 [Flavobacterium succinicans]
MTDFFLYLAYSILMLNLSLYAISFFKKEKVNGFFLLYLLFATIMQLSMEALYHLHKNNLFLMNLFFIGQMFLMGLFYGSLTCLKVQKRIIYSTTALVLSGIGIQSWLDYEQFFQYNLFVIVITNLSVIVFAVFHLYNMLTTVKKYYYFTIGLIIYLLASTMVFVVGNINAKLNNEVKFMLWTFNSILVVLYYLFILYEWKVSFFKNKSRKKMFF